MGLRDKKQPKNKQTANTRKTLVARRRRGEIVVHYLYASTAVVSTCTAFKIKLFFRSFVLYRSAGIKSLKFVRYFNKQQQMT